MSQITIEVEIDHGKLVALQPEKLPLTGRGVLTISTSDEKSVLETEEPDVLPRGIKMKRKAGIDAGKFVVPDDFNDPLPDEFWGL